MRTSGQSLTKTSTKRFKKKKNSTIAQYRGNWGPCVDDNLHFAVERDDYKESEFDQLTSAEALLPRRDDFIQGITLKLA